MAQFGAKYIKFNPIAEQPEDALPIYRNEKPVQLGRLCKADLTVNMASGELYADDELAENLEEFSSGDLAVETDDMLDAVAAEVYGCEVKDGEATYKYGDEPPEGGVAYIKALMRRGKKVYKGVFHPRVKAALGNDTSQTRGSSITFGTTNTKFKVMSCNTGAWKKTAEFEDEKAAKDWVDKMLAGKPAGTDPAPTDPEDEGGTDPAPTDPEDGGGAAG